MTKDQFYHFKHAIVIDVRTPAEFNLGSVKDALNIPMHQIPERVADFRKIQAPVLICCATGKKSQDATMFLHSCGLNNMYNGGCWQAVNLLITA